MYTITTGMNSGVIYYGFPHPMYGAWSMTYHGPHPHHYHIGGTQYNIQPSPQDIPQSYPYLGPFIPLR
ncbi:hypothetical protein [Niallia sp. 03133]|uniref:hypothetical protein n=1 Tax=Niallia sp. 03133 TaxID=3458060 RepID=UPI004044F408